MWGGGYHYAQIPHFLVPEGGRLDASTLTWSPTAPSSQKPTAGSAVWTGSRMLRWGGGDYFGPAPTSSASPVYAYDPSTDAWTATPVSSNSPNSAWRASTVWTGTAMLVWRGAGVSASFDPVSNVWEKNSSAPIGPRDLQSTAWTGTEMLVWGGYVFGGTAVLGDGARYRPSDDNWTKIQTVGAPSPRVGHAAVWTGARWIIFGGTAEPPNEDTFDVPAPTTALGDGASYDPSTNTWSPISLNGAPSPRAYANGAWTGKHALFWGGVANEKGIPDGALYDPETDQWLPVSNCGAPDGHWQGVALQMGGRILVWGGTTMDFGAIYTPP